MLLPSEVGPLAVSLTAFLAPLLPTLLQLGKKAGEKIAADAGEAVWKKATDLWSRLRPEVEKRPALETAVQDVVSNPNEEAFQKVLTRRLEELLTQNPALARELAPLMASDVVQRVIARRNSEIADVEQQAEGAGKREQEVIAEDGSKITGAKQRAR